MAGGSDALSRSYPVDPCSLDNVHSVICKRSTLQRRRHLVSLFGGVAGLAASVARQGGVSTVVGFARDSSNEISNSKVAEDVNQLVDTADVLGFDLPCNSCWRARRAPQHSSFPSAVRSNQHLMGLPGLSEKDQKFVNKHNVILRRSMNWARKHQAQGGSGDRESAYKYALENSGS